jgi:endoglucanase
LIVKPLGRGFAISVVLDEPLPARLEGRTGLNLEFLPSAYFGKSYLVDGQPGLFPRYPSGPMRVRAADTQITQFAGHTTFDDRGRDEYVEVDPIAAGKVLVLAPEDPQRRVTIEARSGELMLLDGRNVAQNNWYVVRSLIPAGTTGKVAEWAVRPHTLESWTRSPVIGFSQAGYHPHQKKVAVIELDPRDEPLETASVYQVTATGDIVEKLKAAVKPWGQYLRYHYALADFSAIEDPGLYLIEYGDQRTETFPIDEGAPPSASANPWEAIFRQAGELNAALQLLITTKNERYSARFDELGARGPHPQAGLPREQGRLALLLG